MSRINELIAAYRAAWDAFQVAPEGEDSHAAEGAMHQALEDLCWEPCASAEDAAALLSHLDWYVSPNGEGEYAERWVIALRNALIWATHLSVVRS